MSLVTTPTHQLATCAHCASTRVMSITMTLTDGTPVEFASCQRCERRTWSESGSDLGIKDVLRKAQKPAK